MEEFDIFDKDVKIVASVSELYGRTEESLNEDVATLKIWMESQPHLPEILDDKSIRNFLISNKCSVEKTKQKIDMYYTIRSKIPEVYDNINPANPIMKEITELQHWVLLPKLTKEKYRVFFYKVHNPDKMEELNPYNTCAFAVNLEELRLKEDVMFGDVFIIDIRGLPLGYVKKLTPTVVAKCIAIYQNVYSIPLKGLYVINAPYFINMVLSILKNLLKPKIFQRIHVCEDESILHEVFPKEMLPRDYGGEEKSVQELHDLIMLKLQQYQDRFDTLDKLRVNESLRPKKLENDDILGFYGNFKKLSVD